MPWLALAMLAFLGVVYSARLGRKKPLHSAAIVFYLALVAWIVSVAGAKAFQGSETSLLGWFVFGLVALAASEAAQNWLTKQPNWLGADVPFAAVAFSFGFDVMRPDEYSYIPAAIVAFLIATVAWRVYTRLAGAKRKTNPVSLGLYVLVVSLLTYSTVFKLIDRGWVLPWAYLASAGGLLFAAGQIWLGFEVLLKEKRAPEWVRVGAFNLAVLMMVVAALFVYREFL